MHTQVRSH